MNRPDKNLYFDFLEHTPEPVFICSEIGEVVFINERARRDIGLTSGDSVAIMDFDTRINEEGVWHKLIEEVRSFGASTYVSEFRNIKNERSYPVEVNLKYFKANDCAYLIASAHDVSKRVETERALELNKRVIEQSSKLARVGGWDLDLVDQKLHWTDTVREIHEVPSDYEPDFKTAINFFKEGSDRDFMVADMTAAIEHGAPLGMAEVQLITAKGRTIWVRCVGEVVRRNGQCVRVYGSIQDIDQQKRMEIKLEQSLRLLEQLTRNVPGAVYQVELGKDGIMQYPFVSAGVMELFNGLDLPESGELDMYLNRLIHSEDMKMVKRAINQSAKSMKPFDIEFRHGDGIQTRFLQTSARPESKENGTIVWHGYVRDISEKKKQREELKGFAQVTSEQNKRLLNFTYIVSHNIRSHVANLMGILEILKENEEDAKEKFLPLMQQSVNNLDESLRNLNDIVNIQSKVNLTRKPIELREVVEKSLFSLKVAINKAGIEVKNGIPEGYILHTNPAYIESILLNLLSNAVKYHSSERPPRIGIDIEQNGKEIILTVSDNGIGIDLDKHRDVVFGMYKTFHNHKDAKGLGLFITKTQVEALGGKIDLESTVNKGTTVRIYLYE